MNGFEGFLTELVRVSDKHARFVNTLSMLEYMGARKIFKSQRADSVSISLLYHAADEIRHARLLKRSALRMSDGNLDSYKEEHLLCGSAARKYFQTVDHLSESQEVQLTSPLRYALTTHLVERRVLKIYPMYEAILARESQFCAQHAVIGAILKDEERHMDQVSQRLLQDAHISKKDLERLSAIEETEFYELTQAWSGSLDRL